MRRDHHDISHCPAARLLNRFAIMLQQYYEANWAILQVEVIIPFSTQMDMKQFLDVRVVSHPMASERD